MNGALLNTSSLRDADEHNSEAALDVLCQRYKAIVLYKDESHLNVACHEDEGDTEALSKALQFACGLNSLGMIIKAKPNNREGLCMITKSKLADSSTCPKVAVVAPNDLSFGLARMYDAFAGSIPWDFVAFRAVDAALAWLSAPENLMDNLDEMTQQVHPPDYKGVAFGAD